MKITFKGALEEAYLAARLARNFLAQYGRVGRSRYYAVIYSSPDGPAFEVWGDEKHVRVYQGNQ